MDAETGGVLPVPETGITPAPAPRKSFWVWVFQGPQGLRAGWSIAIFLPIAAVLAVLLSAVEMQIATKYFHHKASHDLAMTPLSAILNDGTMAISLLVAGVIVALIERRRVSDFYLGGTSPVTKFLSGLVAGFAALSVLVGALWAGGWLHFGPVALSGADIVKYAALWGLGFLFVGMTEEGLCRCYLQFTLTRGINFWWALGIVLGLCAILLPWYKSPSVWGIYFFAAAGLLPCLWLYLRKAESSFWYAAWASSTFFGFVHTGNNGENWIGVFAAAAVGFAFCVSVWATGSAWWAIGCHAAWDWAETYFYGTADSGYAARGHLLTTTASGADLWSGGKDGPEGSLLVLPVIALIILMALVQYGRRKAVPAAVQAVESPVS